jgi:hypothetical protein
MSLSPRKGALLGVLLAVFAVACSKQETIRADAPNAIPSVSAAPAPSASTVPLPQEFQKLGTPCAAGDAYVCGKDGKIARVVIRSDKAQVPAGLQLMKVGTRGGSWAVQ